MKISFSSMNLIYLFILFFLFSPTVSCQTKNKDVDYKDFEWLKSYIQIFNKSIGFSGAVLIAKDDKVIFRYAVGFENVEKGIKNRIETRFNLGSGNKMFTAIAIAQLVEQGKLKFEDPVIKYLPNYANQSFASRATIHHLLTHSSGLGDYWDDEYEEQWGEITRLEQRLPFFVTNPLLFEPGEKRSYSNSGFIILGLIIEKVSGQSYFDYIRDHIYKPANMQKSDSYVDNSVADLAINYQGNGSNWYHTPGVAKGGSDGGGFSTLDDMFKFNMALRKNILLSANSLTTIQSDKTPSGETNP